MFKILLSVLILITLFDRFLILEQFGFNYIDDDQAVMWNAVYEYSHGRFHEPRFFGQAYNTHLEAFFALPLYLIGLPLNYALPIITSLLTLLPFVVFAVIAFNNKLYFSSFLAAALPSLLSFEYALITSIPRGFVTGLFFVSLASSLLLLIKFQKFKNPYYLPILIGFLVIIAISINPNSAPLTIFLLTLTLCDQQLKKYFKFIIIGLVLGLLLHYLIQSFYYFYPEVIAHKLKARNWKSEYIWLALTKLDAYFKLYSPFIINTSTATFIIFASLLAALSFIKKHVTFYSLLTTLTFIIFTLGYKKVHDGYDGIYQPLARMYLSLPLIFILSLILMEFYLPNKLKLFFSNRKILLSFTSIILLASFYRFSIMRQTVNKIIKIPNQQVAFSTIDNFNKECAVLEKLVLNHNIDLVVFDVWGVSKMLNYACPVIAKNPINTIFPRLERRTWRLKEEQVAKSSKILLYSFQSTKKIEQHPSTISSELIYKVPRIYKIILKDYSIIKYLKESGFKVREFRK